jgi:hypothetical protein
MFRLDKIGSRASARVKALEERAVQVAGLKPRAFIWTKDLWPAQSHASNKAEDAALKTAALHVNLHEKLVLGRFVGADGFVGDVSGAAFDAVVNAVVAG